MAKNSKQTSKRVASTASKILRDGRLQIMLKRNASSATAERLFHF